MACILLLASVAALHSQTLTFNSSAGYAGPGSADGTGAGALFYQPAATAVDGAGNVYVADSGNHTIRKISPAGVVSTLAGTPGTSGSANGTGSSALFFQPQGMAVDAAGNLYVADTGNNTIRKITPAGVVSTFAGSPGNAGSSDGTGASALFSQPQGLALDTTTNLYVADYGNNTIRKITPAGVVTTLAGFAGTNGNSNGLGTNALFYQPQGVAVDTAFNVYVADTANGTVRKITSVGVVTTLAGSAGNYGSANGLGTNALFYQPTGVALDTANNLYVTEYFNQTVRKITPVGVVTTLAGSAGNYGSADGTPARARFWGPQGVAADSSGNLYVADYFNGTIRKITSGGSVTTLAGSPSIGSADGLNANARFNLPQSVAVDAFANVYVADSVNSTIRKITPAGQVTTFAGSAGNYGNADGTGTNALFNGPQAVAVDSANNIYVADTQNATIRKITVAGVVTTLAGFPGNYGNADGTGTNAQFFKPEGIAVAGANNIYVADTFNNTIREITPAGVVTTLAGSSLTNGSTDGTNIMARFCGPKGLTVDGAGNVFVADYFNHTIRKITAAGVVSTVAGLAGIWGNVDGTNSDARFFQPVAVAVDALGNLLVTDSGNHTIRRITPVGTNWVVSTVAGMAEAPGSSDGTGASAHFYFPAGIALDSAGFVYVADSANNTVRLNASGALLIQITNVTVLPRRSSAILSWTTSRAATTQIQYGPTTAYGNISPLDANLVTNHAVLLTGLLTNTVYYYQLTSTVGGNQATNNGSFSTDVSLILQSPQALYAGVWINSSTAPDRYSSVYKYATVVTGADTCQTTFRPTIVVPAQYDVYLWYSEGSNRSSFAPALVTYQGGAVSPTVDETVPGGSWQLLAGNVPLVAGTNAYVRLGNGTGESNKVVIADAVRWNYSPAQDFPVNGNVPAWWSTFYFGPGPVDSSSPGANGYSLLNDYILGISPTDPNIFLNFNIRAAAQGFQVVFSPWQGSRTYQLQATTNLVNPVWINLANLPVTPIGNGQGVINYTNTLSGVPTFYRLSVQLTP